MDVTITRASETEIHASITGEVDADNCAGIGAALLGIDGKHLNMTIDLSALDFIDSSGISELLRVREIAIEGGGSFTLSSPTSRVRRVFEMTGLLETFGLG